LIKLYRERARSEGMTITRDFYCSRYVEPYQSIIPPVPSRSTLMFVLS